MNENIKFITDFLKCDYEILEGGLEAIEKSLDMMKNKPEGLIKPAVKLTW